MWRGLLDAQSLLPDSEHLWHLVVFTIAIWEILKYIYRWIFKRRSRLERAIERLEEETREKTDEIHKLNSESRRLSAELEEARSKLPQAAIARADREWRDRNTAAAVRQLETWFEENAESIAAIALRLAKFHISRAVPDPGNHLDRARDLLRLARGASPDNREAQELSSELDTVNAALQEQLIRDGDVGIAWNSAMAPRLGAQGEAMLPAVNALREIARYYFVKGLWRVAPLFADRAADLALSGGGALKQVWLSAETTAADYQVVVGNAAEGLRRLDHVLAEARESLPAHAVIIVNARFARAKALKNLERPGEALAEVDAFAQIQVQVQGARHFDTLATRHLRANVLIQLGRFNEALAEILAEIEDLTPIVVEEKGARHPDTLETRLLHAVVLGRLERHRESLAEIEEFAPIEVEVSGARHPRTLTTRYYHAFELEELGRYGDAFLEIDALAQIHAEVKGARHPDMLVTRQFRVNVLSRLGRYDEALGEFDDLAPVMAEVQGARHPDTLRNRYWHALVLGDLRRHGEALAEIDAFAQIQVQVQGACHPETQTTRRLRALCLANLARWDEARSEIDSLPQLGKFGAPQTETVFTCLARIGIEIAAEADIDRAGELREIIRTLTVARGSSYLGTLFARYRLSRHLVQSGHAEQARTEITETISQFDPMTDPGHSLLRSAKALLDVIEGHSGTQTLIV
jgi:tetratricopeptide (TPR) repeat protein